MKHLLYSALLTLILASAAQAECTAHGEWQGQIAVPGSPLKIQVVLEEAQPRWQGHIDIPVQKVKDHALDQIQVTQNKVYFQIPGIPGTPTFQGQMDDNCSTLKGDFTQGGATLGFVLNRPNSQAALAQAAAQAETLKSLAVWLEAQRKALQVVGAAVLIVKDDKVIFEKGFGHVNAAAQKAVDAETLFAIGSSTKAFTAALLARQWEDGLFNWDTPVIDILPDFRLQDMYATQHMTVQDLLTHQSGLPRHDLAWYGSNNSRQELYQHLRYLEPSLQFRQGTQYQNLMYMTAGLISEKLGGESWESLMQKHVLNPLGMRQSHMNLKAVQAQGNVALPYEVVKGNVESLNFRSTEAIGPAGSLFSNLKDMAPWLRFQLGNGTFNKHKLMEPQTLNYMHMPHAILSKQSRDPKIPYILYGLGWMVHPFGGVNVVQHGGNIDGFSAMVGLVPDRHLGVVILTNQDKSPFPHFALLHSIEQVLGLSSSHYEAQISAMLKAREASADLEDLSHYARVPHTRPLHPLSEYTGSYEHPAYGTLSIRESWGKLTLTFRDLGGPLSHVHYDTFKLAQSKMLKGLQVQFETNTLGQLEALTLPLDGHVKPIRFEKQVDPRWLAPSYLEKFVGTYTLQGLGIEVKSDRQGLKLYVPGQTTYVLLPTKENHFKVKDHPGYAVRFKPLGKKFEAVLIQPQGVVKATPKP